jgi:hypothetical protein
LDRAWKYKDSLSQKQNDPHGWWDDTKLHIQVILQTASKTKAALKNMRKNKLVTAIEELKPLPFSKENSITLAKAYTELKEIKDARIAGDVIRCRMKWDITRDRPTPFFLRSMASWKRAGSVKTIKTGTATATTNQEMLEAGEKFYKELFSEKPSSEECRRDLLNKLKNKLSDDSREALEEPIT